MRLTDPVASWVPGFERYGKGGITVRHLLTHVSGLRPDVDLGEPWKGYDAAIELANDEVPTVAARRARSSTATSTSSCSATSWRAPSGEPLERYVARARVRAARHDRHRVPAADRARRPRSRRPSAAASSTRGRARRPTRSRCAAWCTTPRRGAWAAWPVTPACSARRATSRASRGCCSAAARSAPRRVLSPLTVAKMITPATPAGHDARRAASGGTSTRASRPIAASCCRSARSATPASPARRSGSIRARSCS